MEFRARSRRLPGAQAERSRGAPLVVVKTLKWWNLVERSVGRD